MNDQSYIPISHSALAAFLTCPRKFQLYPKYKVKSYEEPLRTGHIAHKVFQKFSQGQNLNDIYKYIDEEVTKELETHMNVPDISKICYKMAGMLKGMCAGNPYWKDIIPYIQHTELNFSYTLPQFGIFGLHGFIDAIIKTPNGCFVIEYKTTGDIRRFTHTKALRANLQATIYYYACKHMGIDIRGVMFMIFKKPQIRQTKKETPEMFEQRLIEDYKARPEFYFYKDFTYRDKDSTDFENRLIKHFSRIERCFQEDDFWMNEESCYGFKPCVFLPICQNDPNWKDYYEEISE